MGVNGRICRDGWDDKDAQVVCRQNNYIRGFAYSHYVEEGKQSSGPYWISNVQCQGHEKSLQECQHTPAGSVNECSSFHYAGVFCFDDQGLVFQPKKKLFQLFATVNRTFLSIDAIPSFYKKNISPMIYNVLEFKKNKFLKTLTF